MPTFKETIALLDEFAVLPKGWCYGEGNALPSDKIETTKLWIAFFKVAGFSRFNAFPGLNGEIRLRIYHNDLMFEVFFETDNSIDIAIEQRKNLLKYIEAATPSEIRENVNYFINDLCLMSVPSITDTSTSKQTHSQPNYLPKEKTAAYQYLILNALSKKAKESVRILVDFTSLSPRNRTRST